MREVDFVLMKLIQSRTTPDTKIQEDIPIRMIQNIFSKIAELLASEPILIHVPAGCHIVGDIHGNVDDLLRIFQEIGYPPKEKYVFLGDYEDRGKFGVEVNLILFALKIKYPNHIFLLRGNHEILHVSQNYSFRLECHAKYNSLLFNQFHLVFRELPIAAIIGKRILCVHGGISPQLKHINTLLTLDKPDEIVDGTLIADLVWSDPREQSEEFLPDKRGCGFFYNSVALNNFLEWNNLDLLIRSHELCNGYNFPFSDSDKCITVFSNTDYCSQKNQAAILNVSSSLNVTVTKFKMFSQEEKEKWRPLLPEWLVQYSKSPCTIDEDPNSEVDLTHKEPESKLCLTCSDVLSVVD